VNASPGAPRPTDDAPAYFEPARSYTSAALLLGGLLVGVLIDLAAGGAAVHIWGWLIAAVVVVGTDAIAIRTARKLRSITVTPEQVRVGEHALTRSSIVTVERDVDPTLPVLGQTMRQGLPRGVVGLTARLADGGAVVIPTRRPERLAATLHLTVAGPSLPSEVRPAEPGDLPGLPEIDRRAETIFRVSGIDRPELPFPADALHDAKAIFVADRPAVGYVRVDEVEGLAHIEGLAVVPGMMRRGIGTSLLEAACSWAAAQGYPAVTLITFADVPWNAAFFATRGFTIVDDVTPELAELRDWEHAVGLDALGKRVVMRRSLGR
jgi:ribosomal protein S18 acetylase RimI-like enzyme